MGGRLISGVVAQGGLSLVVAVLLDGTRWSNRHLHDLVLGEELPHVLIGDQLVHHRLLPNLRCLHLLSSYMLNPEVGVRGVLLQPVATLVKDGQADLEAAQSR